MMKNRIIAVFAFLLLAGAVAYGVLTQNHRHDKIAQSVIRGVKAGSTVHIDLVEFIKGVDGKPERVSRSFHVRSDENGDVRLPSLQQNFDSYHIRFTAKDDSLKTLLYKTAHADAKLHVLAEGFDENGLVEVSKTGQTYTSRADWTGSYSRQIGLAAQDFTDGTPLRFAFYGQVAPDIRNEQSSNIIDVVVTIGGGPTEAGVNIYDPPVGTCTTVDNVTIFPTSTCDVDRMEQHIVPQPEDAPGTIETNYVVAMMLMAEQFSAVMMQQMLAIGQFFDAKEQQETQRDFRRLAAEAHKDYQPGRQMCQYGSFARSLSHSDESSSLNTKAFEQIMMTYYRQPFGASSESPATEVVSRIDQFKETYCDPNDFNAALWLMCRGEHHDANDVPSSGGADQRNRFNSDIQYYRTLGQDLTLDVNYNDAEITDTEQDIVALAKNLYWPVVYETGMLFQYGPQPENSAIYDAKEEFTATRSMIAKTSVAHNSFSAIVGMKSAAIEPMEDHGSSYMKALMRDFGMSEEDIHLYLGDNPSYYSQMEMLTKIMYQHPNFYTNLYDKPANVDRMNASMQAIGLIQQRDRHESQMRQEMLISQLVEQGLRKHTEDVNQRILDLARDYYPPESSGYD